MTRQRMETIARQYVVEAAAHFRAGDAVTGRWMMDRAADLRVSFSLMEDFELEVTAR